MTKEGVEAWRKDLTRRGVLDKEGFKKKKGLKDGLNKAGMKGENAIKGTVRLIRRRLPSNEFKPTQAKSKGTIPNRQKQKESIAKRKKTFGF